LNTKNKGYSTYIAGFTITLLLIFIYAVSPTALTRLDYLFQNIHFQLRGPIEPSSNIVIAEIDEKSIDTLGRWPWPRSTFAKITENLSNLNASVIAFDVIFSSPEKNPLEDNLIELEEMIPESIPQNSSAKNYLKQLINQSNPDEIFSKTLSDGSNTVLGYFFHFSPDGLGQLTEEKRHHFFEDIKKSQFRGFLKSHSDLDISHLLFPKVYAIESNLASFSDAASGSGYFTFNVDLDGMIRRLPLIVRYHDSITKKDFYFPPLSLRILETYLEGTLLFRVGEAGMEEVIMDSDESVIIPTNPQGELEINHLGPRGTFSSFSISDLLQPEKQSKLKEKIQGNIVLIGATATALEDLRSTPFDPALPGVEIHATILDNFFNKSFLSQASPLYDLLLIIITGILCTLIYSRIKPFSGLIFWVFSSLMFFLFGHWVFVEKGFWLTDIYPFFTNTSIAALIMINHYIREEEQTKFIKEVFGQYLSPRVVKDLLTDPSRLKLGGEQKELSAFFTDLANFTTFSEKLSAEDLVSLLNSYFTEMTDILIRNDGTLDRYDGDAIKAFFGAPMYFKDHAKRACWTCIEMQERLSELRKEYKQQGKPELVMRVGINTGEMVVGNIGSSTRMSYGMNGDSVNLAARLEGANKQYGSCSLISESTYQQAKEFIEVRELDTLRVVGRATPIKIYELLGKKGSDNFPIALSDYLEGLDNYKAQNWQDAIKNFQKALKIDPDDGPSNTYLERCKIFMKSPPGEDWDGIFNLTKK
jgi:adenylate cyclase